MGKISLEQQWMFKILKKMGPFVSVSSLLRIMSVTIEFISEEVNMGDCPSNKSGVGGRKLIKKLP